MAAPTDGSRFKWIVVRRIVQGSAIVSADEPFMIDAYSSPADAAVHSSVLGPEMLPIMLTILDGKTLVLRLREPDNHHRRAAAH